MILATDFSEIRQYFEAGKKEQLTFCNNTQYFAIFEGDIMVGFTGILKYANKTIFKNHYVLPEHRGKGYFKTMLRYCLDNYKGLIEATCTKMSINQYISLGFEPIKQFKNGCVKVRLENI